MITSSPPPLDPPTLPGMTGADDADGVASGISPADRNRAFALLAEHRSLLLALRDDELVSPSVSAERALSLSAYVQTLARDLTGPFPFQSDYFAEAKCLAEGVLLDRALAYLAAEASLESTWSAQDRNRKAALREKVGAHLRYLTHFGHAPGPERDDGAMPTPPIAAAPDSADGYLWTQFAAGAASFDDPHDLLGLVDLIIENPTDFGERSTISRDRLDEARSAAQELIGYLERYQHRMPEGDAPLDQGQSGYDLLRRSYTSWVNDYDKVVRVGRFFAASPRTWPAVSNPQRVPAQP